MIVPQGMTVNIGRREYRGGDELPANAPKSIVEHCQKHAAELAEKAKAEKPASPAGNTGDKNSAGGNQ